MNVAVVIPVGPGHRECAKEAEASVAAAWDRTQGPFDAMEVRTVHDHNGAMGRSRARNLAMGIAPADWFFLLDADDQMMPDAFALVDTTQPATFGAVCLDGVVSRDNRWPVTRATLFQHGAAGTLSMGCFVRGDVDARFDPSLEQGEDFDFYLRLPGFIKIQQPLVSISYNRRRVPRTVPAQNAGWREACAAIVDRYRERQA